MNERLPSSPREQAVPNSGDVMKLIKITCRRTNAYKQTHTHTQRKTSSVRPPKPGWGHWTCSGGASGGYLPQASQAASSFCFRAQAAASSAFVFGSVSLHLSGPAPLVPSLSQIVSFCFFLLGLGDARSALELFTSLYPMPMAQTLTT